VSDWKIQRDRSQAEICSRKGCALAGEPEYYAILELPECIRRQVCLTCFEELRSQEGDMPFHWKVRRRTDGSKQAVLDLASLRVLFDRLGEEEEERSEGLRYLVALLLLRKRVLKMADARNAREEAADLLVVDPKIEGMEPVALSAPSLEPEALASLQEELAAAIGETEAQADPD
jgi:hypothetical protein